MQPTITQPAANPPANNDNALPIPLTPLFNEYRKDTCLVQMQQQNYVISHALLVSLTESIYCPVHWVSLPESELFYGIRLP